MTIVFVPIPRERVPFEWERIASLLSSAFAHDGEATPLDVYAWLTSGQSEAFWVGAATNATGIIVTTTGPIDGTEVCWINYAAGTVRGGPRAFIATARAIVDQIEDLAREAGCTELRGGGRNWSRVFPEWEHFDPEHPNRMRKLING